MSRGGAIKARAIVLLWVYCFLLLSQAVHAAIPLDEAPGAHTFCDAPVLTRGCDGPCDDPSHHHAPAPHDDHCPVCKATWQAQGLAPARIAPVDLSGPTIARRHGVIDRAGRDFIHDAPARAPPRAD